MNTVVDSSVLVAALIDVGPLGKWAEAIISRGLMFAPELVLVETTNVLRRFERAKLISTPEANAAQADLMQLGIELFPYEPFAGRIWELRHNVTSYDAWYVAMAESLTLPLATTDEPLSKASAVHCKFLLPRI